MVKRRSLSKAQRQKRAKTLSGTGPPKTKALETTTGVVSETSESRPKSTQGTPPDSFTVEATVTSIVPPKSAIFLRTDRDESVICWIQMPKKRLGHLVHIGDRLECLVVQTDKGLKTMKVVQKIS